MSNVPESQKGLEDLTDQDRRLAEEVREAEEAAGIKHPDVKRPSKS